MRVFLILLILCLVYGISKFSPLTNSLQSFRFRRVVSQLVHGGVHPESGIRRGAGGDDIRQDEQRVQGQAHDRRGVLERQDIQL